MAASAGAGYNEMRRSGAEIAERLDLRKGDPRGYVMTWSFRLARVRGIDIRVHSLTPLIGSVRLRDLRADHVLALKAHLLAVGLAPATVKKIIGLVKQGLGAAVAANILPRNPASSVPAPPVVGQSQERRALTEEEITKVLAAASGTQFAVAIRLAIATGARQAELLGATWEAVSLLDRTFIVKRTLAHIDGEFQTLPPKTRNSRRPLELSEATVALLRSHRAAQSAERLRLGPIWRDHDLVLPRPDGRPQYRQSFYRGYKRIVEASGIGSPESVNFHSLRHTAASLWIKHGVDLFTVSRRLGHSSAAFTMDQYGHLLPGQQRHAAEALDHLLA